MILTSFLLLCNNIFLLFRTFTPPTTSSSTNIKFTISYILSTVTCHSSIGPFFPKFNCTHNFLLCFILYHKPKRERERVETAVSMDMANKAGVRRRARAALAIEADATEASPAPSPKRRKINKNSTSQGLEFSASLFVDQLPSIGEETLLPAEAVEERCPFSPAASDEYPASCCSSNGSVELDEERIKFIDHEVQSSQAETSTCNCGDEIRRETSLLSELETNMQEVESMEKSTTKANSRCVLSTQMKIPTELELEEFFAAAEKDIQKRFSDKYNYDIVKDEPLEGRYEWVQLNP